MTALDRGDPLRVAHGELALLSAAHLVGWLDFEHAEHAHWLAEAERLAAELPPGGRVLDAVRLFDVCDRVERLRRGLERRRRLSSGEADWVEIVRLQGYLRDAVTNAMASLHHHSLAVWRSGAPPDWPRAVAPAPGEEVS